MGLSCYFFDAAVAIELLYEKNCMIQDVLLHNQVMTESIVYKYVCVN